MGNQGSQLGELSRTLAFINGVTSLLRTSTAVGIFVGPDTHTCILQLQRNPFLTPEESNTVDRKSRDALNLHGSGGQRILLSQNIGL
ncbi:hypothetical protein TNCV_569221 [Trichonephila clavipes]|nr:hypothetical protein TNCV_569221 [Trichonephila clavipes]